jgi:hypothetical protein
MIMYFIADNCVNSFLQQFYMSALRGEYCSGGLRFQGVISRYVYMGILLPHYLPISRPINEPPAPQSCSMVYVSLGSFLSIVPYIIIADFWYMRNNEKVFAELLLYKVGSQQGLIHRVWFNVQYAYFLEFNN